MDEKCIPYKTIIQEECKCRVILDIVQEHQNGMTWRPLEALFYGKKLITNYPNIQEAKFYSKNNIFVLGEQSTGDIKEFIKKDMELVPEEIVEEYTFSGWLKRLKDEI